MKSNPIASPLLRVVLVVMCAIWTVSGWYIIATGSFSTKPKLSTVTTTVDGPGAEFMGAVLVALGLIALAALLQSRVPKTTAQLWVGLLFVLPAIFVLTG